MACASCRIQWIGSSGCTPDRAMTSRAAVSTLAIGYAEWVEVLDEILSEVSEVDRRKFWRDNAMRIYRL
jgi:hypothetical protein